MSNTTLSKLTARRAHSGLRLSLYLLTAHAVRTFARRTVSSRSSPLTPTLRVVPRAYEWTCSLYAAVDTTTGENFCAYLPPLDGSCLEAFLKHLAQAYVDHRLVVVLDGAPSHTSKEIELPENVSLLPLPSYSPPFNPVERWFQEFRCALANKVFETIRSLQEALTRTLDLYWDEPARLQSLTGLAW